MQLKIEARIKDLFPLVYWNKGSQLPRWEFYIINKSAIGIINTAFSPVERGFRYGTEF